MARHLCLQRRLYTILGKNTYHSIVVPQRLHLWFAIHGSRKTSPTHVFSIRGSHKNITCTRYTTPIPRLTRCLERTLHADLQRKACERGGERTQGPLLTAGFPKKNHSYPLPDTDLARRPEKTLRTGLQHKVVWACGRVNAESLIDRGVPKEEPPVPTTRHRSLGWHGARRKLYAQACSTRRVSIGVSERRVKMVFHT